MRIQKQRLIDFYRNKRVWISGHTGFKGSWLSAVLRTWGAEVAGYSVDIPSEPSLFESLELKLRDERKDIRNAEDLEKSLASFKPEIVFHLAAQSLVRKGFKFPVDTFETNVMGTVNILEAIRGITSVRSVVVATSDKAYFNQERDYAYKETDPLGGKEPYGASKAAAECVVQAYSNSFFDPAKCRVASVRAGNVIGGGDWSEDRIVADCVRAWSAGKPVEIRSPKSDRPWQHVLEPLSGYLSVGKGLYEKKIPNGEAFNFGPHEENNVSVLELVTQLEKAWPGTRHEIASVSESLQKEATKLNVSSEKAQRVLGWKPRLDFKQTVEWTASWYFDHHKKTKSATELTQSQIEKYFSL